MKAIAALILAALLSACSVNVVVAPHATFAVESLNNDDDTAQTFHAKTVEVLP